MATFQPEEDGTVSLDYQNIEDFSDILPRIPSDVTHLDLHGNRLVDLPDDLSSLRNLRVLNLEQNAFENVSAVLPGLRSLPSLEELNITMQTEDEEVKLIVGLPNLKRLNGTSLGEVDDVDDSDAPGGARKAFSPSFSRDVALTQDDLEKVASMYGKILSMQNKQPEDSRYLGNFDAHVQKVMKGLSTTLEGLEDPFLRQGEILRAKHKLYDVCFKELVEHAEMSSPQFGQVLRMLHEVHGNLFGKFPAVLHEMRPHYVQKLADMHSEVVRAERETNMLLEAAEVLEKEAVSHAEEKSTLRKAIDEAKANHQAEISELKAQNEKLQQTLANCSEGSSRGRSLVSAVAKSYKSAPRATRSSPVAPSRSDRAANEGGSKPRRKPAVIRNLSLKQLKDYVEQIYVSKIKFDEKCSAAHLPRETLEQHMYTYLNQRYGLKQLIIDHASAIIKAVNRYSSLDNDIAVFGKILRNEIDEEFRYVQQQLKDTVAELLRVYLQSKHPMKTDHAINALLASRLEDSGTLREDEWVDIVKYMYNHEDCLTLIVMVKEVARRTAGSSEHASPRKGVPRSNGSSGDAGRENHEVRFKDFLKVLLDFQLKGHEKFLAKFRVRFREFDADANGVLNEAEFRQFVRSVSPAKSDESIEELVAKVDPYNNEHITYSEAVTAMTAELIDRIVS